MRRPGTTKAVALGLAIALLAACTNGDETSTTTTEVVAPGRPDVPTGEAVLAIGGGDRLLPEAPGEKIPGTDVRFPGTVIEGYAATADGTLYFHVEQYRGALYRYDLDGLVERVDIDVEGLGASLVSAPNLLTVGLDGNLYAIHAELVFREWLVSRLDLEAGTVEPVVEPLQVGDNFHVADFVIDESGQIFVIGGTSARDEPRPVMSVDSSGVPTPLAGFTVPGCRDADQYPFALALNPAGDLGMAAVSPTCPAVFVRRNNAIEIVAGVSQLEPRTESVAPCPDADEPFDPIALAAFGDDAWLTLTRCPRVWLVTDSSTPPRPVASIDIVDGYLADQVVAAPDGLAWIAGLDALYLVRPAV